MSSVPGTSYCAYDYDPLSPEYKVPNFSRHNPLSSRPDAATSSSGDHKEATQCVICGTTPGKPDTRCGSCNYCSKKCQEADWPSHKLLCKEYFQQSHRPNTMHHRAILFKQDQTRPSLTWVECETEREPGIGPRENPKVALLLGEDDPCIDRRLVQKNTLRDKSLSHTIEVIFRDTFLIDGSRPNRSIEAAIGASGSLTHRWRGPGLVMHKLGLGTDPRYYGDITLEDYRHVLDYFIAYADDSVREPEKAFRSHNTVLGVKVTCFGEQKLHGADAFVPVEVSNTHPTRVQFYEQGEISPISRMVNLPIRAWRIPYNWEHLPHWPSNTDPTSNGTACMLFLEPDVEKPNWGWAPQDWQSNLGNVLLVSAKGGDLSVEDAKLLCRFCREKLAPLFEDALGGGYVYRTKKEVVNFITPLELQAYRKEMQI